MPKETKKGGKKTEKNKPVWLPVSDEEIKKMPKPRSRKSGK